MAATVRVHSEPDDSAREASPLDAWALANAREAIPGDALIARREVPWLELEEEGRRPVVVLTRDEALPNLKSNGVPAPRGCLGSVVAWVLASRAIHLAPHRPVAPPAVGDGQHAAGEMLAWAEGVELRQLGEQPLGISRFQLGRRSPHGAYAEIRIAKADGRG
jgi:hypothetical protein